MKKLFLISILAVAINVHAQEYVERIGFKLESIADIDIGWIKTYSYPAAPAGKTLGHRTYSAKQIGYCQQFIQWMQQSYIPKGCLGDAAYYLNSIPKFSGTNSKLGNAIAMHDNALPHMYGAYSKMYMFLKKDDKGKFIPQNNFAEYWRIEANSLQHISNPVTFISSEEEYYFMIPDYKNNPKGYNSEDKPQSDLKGFDKHSNIAAYNHFYIPPKTINDFAHYVVIMTKDNELPFEKITIGEFFAQAEKQFPVWKEIVDLSEENYAIAKKNLARLKEKYKKRWDNLAELEISDAITLQDFVNANVDQGNDLFDHKDSRGNEYPTPVFPILKVKKPTLALCKTDQPQWLVIRWTLGMPNEPFNLHLHESILNNFNFDYAYKFFFDPEKVKGQAYKPLRSPSLKEAVVLTEASANSKKFSSDKSVFLFDDFSTTAVGKKPAGWTTKLANAGTTAIVSNPEGLDGNWVELRGHYLKIAFPKEPLSQNFTLTYDLVAAQGFTWGSKGLTMQLSKESAGNAESYLRLKLRPGFDGRDGETEVETKFPSPPGYSNGTKWYKAPGFSNNKKYNRILVSIKKREEKLEVFIDNNKIAEYEKAIPAAHLFNALSFDCGGNSAENDKYFISNIKITRD